MEMDEDIDYEKYENRLKTFQCWPNECPDFIKDLADVGFAYTGQDDIVFCCRCKKNVRNWKEGDSPLERHKNVNSSCSYLAHREEVLRKSFEQSRPGFSSHSTNSPTGLNQASSRNRVDTAGCEVVNSNVIFANNSTLDMDLDNDQISIRRTANFEQSRRNADVPKLIIPTRFDPSTQGKFLANNSPSQNIRQYSPNSTRINEVSPRLTPQSTSPRPTQNVCVPSSHLPNILNQPSHIRNTILADKLARLQTFVTWPQDACIQPLELAEAGFYYLKLDDKVQCYKCQINLCNWNIDDTAWTEHIKWSPSCPLVLEYQTGQNEHRQIPRSPLSAASYALPTQGVFQSHRPSSNYSTQHSFVSQPNNSSPSSSQPVKEITIQSGIHLIGNNNTLVDERPQRQKQSYTEFHSREHPNQHATEPQSAKLLLSERDVDNLLDAGFTLEIINEVQEAGFHKYQSYFSSVETIADAIMHYMDHGNLDTHTVHPTSPGRSASKEQQRTEQTQSPKPQNTEVKQDDQVDLRKELDRVKEMQMCKICMDQQVGIVFFPCGHLLTCPTCSTGMEQCPLCRAAIQSSSRIYLS